MKKTLFLFALLITAQSGASHYDVIYRFENQVAGNDQYFEIKIDFDYVAPDEFIPPEQQQVFNYEQFEERYWNPVDDDGEVSHPIFFFEFTLLDTNMMVEPAENSLGSSTVFATNQPVRTGFSIGESFGFKTDFLPMDREFFPTHWELGLIVYNFDDFNADEPFALTEITQIPLPGALPLFVCALMVMAQVKTHQAKPH